MLKEILATAGDSKVAYGDGFRVLPGNDDKNFTDLWEVNLEDFCRYVFLAGLAARDYLCLHIAESLIRRELHC